MSGLDLGNLGLVQDGATSAALGVPAAEEAPVTPAAPAAPAPEPTPEPEHDEEIVVPDGAENPDAVKNLIAAERASARAAYKRARDAEAKLAAIEEANTPVEDRLTNTQSKLGDVQLENLRLRTGLKHGLSVTLSEMLRGNDEPSLEQSAQTLLSELGARPAAPTGPPGYTLNGGYQTPPPATTDPHQAHAQFLGQLLGRRGA